MRDAGQSSAEELGMQSVIMSDADEAGGGLFVVPAPLTLYEGGAIEER